MKLFSRKGLAAAATTVALTATALTAPAMAQTTEETTPVETTASTAPVDEPGGDTTPPTGEPADERPTVTETVEPGSSLSSEDTDPGDIKDWIGVFTTVIGALSALFVFMDRHVIEN